MGTVYRDGAEATSGGGEGGCGLLDFAQIVLIGSFIGSHTTAADFEYPID